MKNPFVFISYAHVDSKTVLPIIDAMKKRGINIWYDNGIEAGSEWPEYIAMKVNFCTKFVSFISEAYLSSQNCTRELNFAVSRRKELLSVYLEDVNLSLGIEMQLGTYQAIFKYRFSTYEQFILGLCKEHFFDACRLEGVSSSGENQQDSFIENEECDIIDDVIEFSIFDKKENFSEICEEYTYLDTEEDWENEDVVLKGQLCGDIKQIREIDSTKFRNPIKIDLCDGRSILFDFCEEIISSGNNKYIIAMQPILSNKCLFYVFSEKDGKKTLLTEGKAQRRAYRIFIDRHKDEYSFIDKNEVGPLQQKPKTKHFSSDAVVNYYKTSNNIPDVLTIPDKYAFVSSYAFEKLGIKDKPIRQIIISDVIQEIADDAFEGFVVTEMVYIPSTVTKIGKNAFKLKEGAFVYCEKFSEAYNYCFVNGISCVIDHPFVFPERDIEFAFSLLSENNSYTRIRKDDSMRLFAQVEEFVLPENIIIVDEEALRNIKISKRIVISPSVKMIGKYAFNLMPEAYVDCDKDSYAYLYCKENGIKNSVDISNHYRAIGVCKYCGGKFSGLFKKKCSLCGKEKDY